MVYYMAAYSGISGELYEAAIIDGANKPAYFFKIALPLLKPAIRNACILSMVGSLKYFDLIFVMTNGGPGEATELMATYMYKLSFKQFKSFLWIYRGSRNADCDYNFCNAGHENIQKKGDGLEK